MHREKTSCRPIKNQAEKTKRMNCWEFYTCPEERQQACPAFTRKAGRSCWIVAGTLCGGQVQGTMAKKIGDCRMCDFYIRITLSQA